MKRLTESPLETQVEELAALFFSIQEIALFTGLDEDELRSSITGIAATPLSKAYYRGQQRTAIRLRFDELNYALHGSPQAAQEMKEHLSDQIIKENA